MISARQSAGASLVATSFVCGWAALVRLAGQTAPSNGPDGPHSEAIRTAVSLPFWLAFGVVGAVLLLTRMLNHLALAWTVAALWVAVWLGDLLDYIAVTHEQRVVAAIATVPTVVLAYWSVTNTGGAKADGFARSRGGAGT